MAKAKTNEERLSARARAELQAPAPVPWITPEKIPYRPVKKTVSCLEVMRKVRKVSRIEQKLLGKAHCYPISPRDHLYLVSEDDQAPRFAGIFKYTWKKIPTKARRALVKYWQAAFPPFPFVIPRIALDESQDRPGVEATTAVLGSFLWFFATAIRAHTDEYVAYLVAHELAHVYQIATKAFSHAKRKKRQMENDADLIVHKWGFDIFRAEKLLVDFCKKNRKLHRFIMGKTDEKP